jgi:hypothetical protein
VFLTDCSDVIVVKEPSNILKEYPERISWKELSANTGAIELLEKNIDKINWEFLSSNKKAIHLLKANIDKIHWNILSMVPEAIDILRDHIYQIDWKSFSMSPAIFTNTYQYNYKAIRDHKYKLHEEFIRNMFHPANKPYMTHLGFEEFSDDAEFTDFNFK